MYVRLSGSQWTRRSATGQKSITVRSSSAAPILKPEYSSVAVVQCKSLPVLQLETLSPANRNSFHERSKLRLKITYLENQDLNHLIHVVFQDFTLIHMTLSLMDKGGTAYLKSLGFLGSRLCYLCRAKGKRDWPPVPQLEFGLSVMTDPAWIKYQRVGVILSCTVVDVALFLRPDQCDGTL